MSEGMPAPATNDHSLVHVRAARAEDAGALVPLIDALRRDQRDPTGHMTADALRRDAFGPDPACWLFVAEIDSRLVGYALCTDAYESSYAARGVYLGDLYVTPEARGSGAGRALLAAVAADAKTRGRVYVWWCSKAWNAKAQAFYRHVGALQDQLVGHAIAWEAFEALAEEGSSR